MWRWRELLTKGRINHLCRPAPASLLVPCLTLLLYHHHHYFSNDHWMYQYHSRLYYQHHFFSIMSTLASPFSCIIISISIYIVIRSLNVSPTWKEIISLDHSWNFETKLLKNADTDAERAAKVHLIHNEMNFCQGLWVIFYVCTRRANIPAMSWPSFFNCAHSQPFIGHLFPIWTSIWTSM